MKTYEYKNPHPKGKRVGDCVKRAITLATGGKYMEVQRQLNAFKKKTGAEKFSDNINWRPFIKEELGAIEISFPATKGTPRMNGERFCAKYPKGRYILRMAGHLAACVDGVIYDTWDSSQKCVYSAFRITDADKIKRLQ